ncbi:MULTISPECIES: isochorismatase family protein [unclassified Erwinia]|uniref:isochorismatase family protein n=1 Tax=unclassified Erwinia TaxID=2622719 RepID=UPI0007007D49|nr:MULTISPECIES: isochorismatase family protein [unclassified Erwinia]KQN53832.1 hydrolase [Erwinia sp. Leaf53]PLV62311.1 hydrolase [Erwinia sp. B116]
MTDTVLLVIDAQQSFYHRGYRETPETPAFEQALSALVAGCQQRGIAVVDVLHEDDDEAFRPESGLVTRLPFLSHQPVATFHKRVHNALTESGLQQWLEQQQVKHVIISGLRSEQCCETTARVASDFGYQVTYVTEATLTFPITHNGITLSVADLRHRTESVLINRFADIATVEQCLHKLG